MKVKPNTYRAIIGKPVSSCLKAQVMSSNAGYKYVQDAGFVRSRDYSRLFDFATVSFTYEHEGFKARITVPLLTIVPVSMLRIENVNLSFIANLQENGNGTYNVVYGNSNGNGWGYNEETRYTGQMKVALSAKRYNYTPGIEKLLTLAYNNGLTEKPFNPSDYEPAPDDDSEEDTILPEDPSQTEKPDEGSDGSEEKSPLFRRYLQLRQRPIEQRAKMPYATIVKDNHIVYTDCCRIEDDDMLFDFSALLTPEKNILKDVVDEEDMMNAVEATLSWDNVINIFGAYYNGESVAMMTLKAIENIFNELGVSYRKNYTIPGTSLKFDFYLPESKVLVDCISSTDDDTAASIDKYKNQTVNDYQILVFKDKNIYGHERLIKSIIASKLSLCNKRYSANKCYISEISDEDADLFYNAYHIQGKVNDAIHLGLIYDGKLVEMMSFSQIGMAGNFELVRIASRHMSHVVAGATKMFTYFQRNFNWNTIVAYASKDLCNGIYVKSPNGVTNRDVFQCIGFRPDESLADKDNDSICGIKKYILRKNG